MWSISPTSAHPVDQLLPYRLLRIDEIHETPSPFGAIRDAHGADLLLEIIPIARLLHAIEAPRLRILFWVHGKLPSCSGMRLRLTFSEALEVRRCHRWPQYSPCMLSYFKMIKLRYWRTSKWKMVAKGASLALILIHFLLRTSLGPQHSHSINIERCNIFNNILQTKKA